MLLLVELGAAASSYGSDVLTAQRIRGTAPPVPVESEF
jgi:hypothetical protein